MLTLKSSGDKVTAYKIYIKILSSVLDITKKEGEVLALLLLHGNPIVSEIRQAIRVSLGISSYSLNNYIFSLKQKGLILDDGNGDLYVNRDIIPLIRSNKLSVVFEIDIV